MHAWEFRYPDFKEGQVLTHNDLNLLRDFLYSRTAAHARLLFGFGVACGLEGSLAGMGTAPITSKYPSQSTARPLSRISFLARWRP